MPLKSRRPFEQSAETAGMKAATLIHATRVAVTGRAVSAGLFDVLALLGKSRVVRRVRVAVDYTTRTSPRLRFA